MTNSFWYDSLVSVLWSADNERSCLWVAVRVKTSIEQASAWHCLQNLNSSTGAQLCLTNAKFFTPDWPWRLLIAKLIKHCRCLSAQSELSSSYFIMRSFQIMALRICLCKPSDLDSHFGSYAGLSQPYHTRKILYRCSLKKKEKTYVEAII